MNVLEFNRDDPMLTVAEISAALRISKMTVYRLMHQGDLASVRIGRAYRVRESEVHRYLAGAVTPVAKP